MKTNRLSTFKTAGWIASITVASACVAKSLAVDQAATPTPAAPVVSPVAVSTNPAGGTNASPNTRAPLARIPPSIPTSPGLAEIVKLAQSGVEQDVLLSYVNTSQIAYNPTADEVIYLHDIGIPPKVVTAIVERGKQLREQAAAAQANAATAPASPGNISGPPLADAPPYNPGYPTSSPSYNLSAPAVAPAPTDLPPQVDQFYTDLSPYGTWYDLPDYGWAWQPTVAITQPGWRPYCDYGRWLDSDCGWYWQSDYSWGWAPFHYGRWCNYGGLGWTWVPGSVWGPSWVCWRNSPLYCGWAPLPPGAVCGLDGGFSYFGAGVGVGFGFGLGFGDFTFLPWGRFCDWNPSGFCLGPGLAANVFNQSTVNNRYFRGPSGRIMNLGADPARVAAAARSEIPKVTVRDLTPAAGKIVKPDRLERDGSSLVVYRPQPLSRSPAKPGGQLAYHRQELAPQPAAAQPAGQGASVTARQPVPTSAQNQAALASAATSSTRNLVPVVHLPVSERTSSDFNRLRTRGAQSPLPLLGRYPTQASGLTPVSTLYNDRMDAASLPMPLSSSRAGAPSRQEILKPAPGSRRFMPQPPSRSEALASIRPAFYNPPPITQRSVPVRAGLDASSSRSSVLARAEPAAPRQNPRATSYRPELARSLSPSFYQSRPQPSVSRPNRSPSYSRAPSSYGRSTYRTPSYSSPRSYGRPTYSAPSYSYRPSYSTPHYAPSVPSYHSVGGFGSVSHASSFSGRSSSSSSRSGR